MEIPWRRAWQPTPVFFPGESHGQRSLAGYSPCGHKESDTTKQLSIQTHIHGLSDPENAFLIIHTHTHTCACVSRILNHFIPIRWIFLLHFMFQETEAQRGRMTCPRTPS